MLKALLFDLDGTLAETDSVHHPTWAELLKPHGYDVDWAFFQERMSGRLNPDIVTELLPNLSEEEGLAMVEAKEADFRERAAALEPLPGLIDFVEWGRERGLEMALVTNAPRENVLAVLRSLALDEAFDPIILADDVGVAKPDPAPYAAALDALGVEAGEALAFEDSPSGIASSIGAGIPTVGVASTQEPGLLGRLGVVLVVHDFTDPGLRPFVEAS
ncbi:MAG: Beta-phosphoglucomutase [uncultured Rubrobacteraceae bacterium]|uniref:Beta-phosphoglucomutase n=1 Tax=uncultured Rubrobacteraceae bacterium TaxID=349277 RepID=A0A6J4R5Z9_9ACTN|nr:MAG: Beta-phosphoglucomutase [uncultured Rubrobacteraceae bacterium]